MDLKHLKELYANRPFRAFTLRLADGRSRKVPHPELIAFLGNGRTIFWADGESDSFELIDLIMIVSAEVSRSSPNGHSRRKAG
jgi:hypothetical protein